MDIRFRPETPADHRAVECLTRDAFWNRYRPGCDEHLALHQLRQSPAFIPELDLVAEDADGQLVGHICYVEGRLIDKAGGTIRAIGFGPVSVRPELQGQGIGTRIIRQSLELAARLGHEAVFITGDPAYYQRFGFTPAARWGLHLAGTAPDDPAPYFMVLALRPGALADLAGTFHFDPAYETTAEDLAAFEKHFPPREKLVLPGQIFT